MNGIKEKQEYKGPSYSALAVSYITRIRLYMWFLWWLIFYYCYLLPASSTHLCLLNRTWGSLERPSHSIDLAEVRRYCIMYYQQSYVLIFSHEMALFPFTYYLNFKYLNLYPHCFCHVINQALRSCLKLLRILHLLCFNYMVTKY